MSPAESARAAVFLSDVAYPWPSLAEARARFSWPEPPEASKMAELAGGAAPSRFLSLKEFKGVVIIPPGPPRIVGNVWLCYPGRRHAVTAHTNTLLFDSGDNPAWGIGEWLFMAVDPNERPSSGPATPPRDRTALVVDGVEHQTWHYQEAGLHCRAARVEDVYYAAICPVGEAGETQLVTR